MIRWQITQIVETGFAATIAPKKSGEHEMSISNDKANRLARSLLIVIGAGVAGYGLRFLDTAGAHILSAIAFAIGLVFCGIAFVQMLRR